MNFEDSADEQSFRSRVRAWIQANAPKHLEPELRRASFGSTGVSSEDPIAASRAWQRKKAAAGFACPGWPKEYGGGGFSPIQRMIWDQEEGPYLALSAYFTVGQGMCGPTLIAWASNELKQRRLPKLASGEEIWCQLFSEPSAGSDLAGLATRVRRTDDGWLANGQKIWTSGAHLSDYGLLLARTDPELPKHKGLTMFMIDMHWPGVEVRPIRQASGHCDFNEVFLSDVAIPDTHRVGGVGQGWEVALTTLMNERLSIGAHMSIGFDELFEYCLDARIDDEQALDNAMVRSRLAEFAVCATGLKYLSMRAMTKLSKGETPGPEASIGKLVAGRAMQDLSIFALDLQGESGVLSDHINNQFQTILLRSPGARIEGGSDEILRNIIAERVLGLPGEPRVDKRIPFSAIPTNLA